MLQDVIAVDDVEGVVRHLDVSDVHPHVRACVEDVGREVAFAESWAEDPFETHFRGDMEHPLGPTVEEVSEAGHELHHQSMALERAAMNALGVVTALRHAKGRIAARWYLAYWTYLAPPSVLPLRHQFLEHLPPGGTRASGLPYCGAGSAPVLPHCPAPGPGGKAKGPVWIAQRNVNTLLGFATSVQSLVRMEKLSFPFSDQ